MSRSAARIANQTEGVTCLATLSENPGLNSYLCCLENGQVFAAATSGMGAPSLSIMVNELVAVGIAEKVRAGDLVISSAALVPLQTGDNKN